MNASAYQELFDKEFLQKIEGLSFLAKRLRRGTVKGSKMMYRKGSSLEFFDYRSYQHGDDLRYIDWNIFARLSRLFVKLFYAEEEITVHLLLDRSKSMEYGTRSKSLFQRKTAAALGYIASHNLDRVGVSSFNNSVSLDVEPRRRKNHIFTLLNFLVQMKNEGETDFNRSLKEFAAATKRPGLTIVISDLMDPGGIDEGLLSLRYFGHDVVLIHILDESEISPDFSGFLRLKDAETEEEIKVSIDSAELEEYRRQVALYFRGIETLCIENGIEYLRTTVSVPFEDLILKYLRQGLHLK